MFALSPTFRPCFRSLSRPLASTSTRGVASSIPPRERALGRSPASEPEFEELEDLMSTQHEGERSENATSYRQFMETIGSKYQFSAPGKYLGKTPFPMNPSFKPPPPISDAQKEVIYRLYASHRLENGPRRLAKRFNISLARVNAILRLKILEKSFENGQGKKRTLQTGFQIGMEKLLGATTHSAIPAIQENLMRTGVWLDKAVLGQHIDLKQLDPFDPTHPEFELPNVNEVRSDVHKADMLEEEERRDATPSRFERLYWESVPEDGREPLLPSILQTSKQEADLRKLKREIDESKKFLIRTPQTEFIRRPKTRSFVVGRPRGRKGPLTKFVDVGGRFMDLDDRIRAMGVSKSRSRRRERKALETQRANWERGSIRRQERYRRRPESNDWY